ncbi:MAG: hypothetical protein PHC64_04660 [Candidatus Gastranaerophilales bacterium]|nr:hypothetical protein [Candidatus Gastranaerophilales bacterium]
MIEKNKQECFICHCKDVTIHHNRNHTCPYCGEYNINDYSSSYVPEKDIIKYRYVVKKHQIIDIKENKNLSENIGLSVVEKRVQDINVPKLLEKIELVMNYIGTKTTFLFEKTEIDTNTLFPLFFCKNNYELYQIIEYLKNIGYIETFDKYYKGLNGECFKAANFNNKIPIVQNQKINYEYNYYIFGDYIYHQPCYQVSLTPKGLKHQADKQYNHLNSTQAFVAMWFNDNEDKEKYKPNMNKIYEDVIQPAIEDDKRFEAVKIDCVEHCNDINDEMIAQIRKSRFIVADLTGYRGGVYWEAGFAYGLGMPVVYTCHEKWQVSDESKGIEKIHFDVNHRNIIFWNEDNLDDFKKRLSARISAIIV